MPKQLTARSVDQAKSDPAKRREIPDAGSGLYLIIQPSGAKSWAVRYRFDGKPRKLTLGPYPRLTLADARGKARGALEAASEGRDPAAAKKAAQRAAREGIPEEDLFRSVAEQFLHRYVRVTAKESYARETERLLNKEVLPSWGDRRIHDITKRDVIDLLDGIH